MHSIVKRIMSYLFFAFVFALVLNICISSEVNAFTNEKSDKIKNIASAAPISSEQQEILALKTPAESIRTMAVIENGSQDFHTMDLGANLIENGDFELDPNYYGTWEAYNSIDVKAAFNWDDLVYHGDSGKSISIQGSGVSSYLINGIAIAPGKAYSFEAWARAVDIVTLGDEFGVCVYVGQYNAEGNLIDGTDYYFFQEGTFDWQPADLKFVSNPKAESLIITLFLNGSGTVWFDDVSLFDEGDIPTPLLKVVADPGMNKSTYKGFDVALDGSKSINSYAAPLSYSWAFVSKPDGSLCVLADSDTVSPSFRPDIAGDYIISLTVDNGLGDNDTKQVTIRAKEFNDMQDDINYNLMNNMEQNYITGYTIADMIPLSDGWVIIGDSNSRQINIINALTGEVGRSYQLSTTPSALDFDFDFDSGIIVATQAADNKIVKIDLNKDELNYIETSVDYNNLIFGENGVVFAYSSSDTSISVIDIQSNLEVSSCDITSEDIGFMVYDKNKNNLLLGAIGISPSSLYRYVYDETNYSLAFAQYVWNFGSNGRDLSISKDGNHAAFCCGGGNGNGYTIFDVNSSDIDIINIFGEWYTDAYPNSADFSHDNNYIVTYNCSDIQLFDISTHEFIRNIGSVENFNYCSVRISRGDKIVFSEGMNSLYFYKMDGTSTTAAPIIVNSITTDVASPQVAGNKINISANVSGGADNNYYHFWAYDGNMWTLLQLYTTENTFEWTPQTEGMYYLVVGVKDKNSSNVYDAYNTIPYIVTKPVPVPTLIEIAGPNSVVIPSDGSISMQYTAIVKDQYGSPMTDESVTWSLEGASTGVSINSSTGVVTVESTALAGTFTVRATDGTATNAFVVTINEPLDSYISPISASFDRKTSAQADIMVTMTLNGNTLREIKRGIYILANNGDYIVSGESVVIKKEYLVRLPIGDNILTFNFSAGNNQYLDIIATDSRIEPPVVSFDKNISTGTQADISLTLDLSGSTLNVVKNCEYTLVHGIDYRASGSTIVLNKNYLNNLSTGDSYLTFFLNNGEIIELLVNVTDSTPAVLHTVSGTITLSDGAAPEGGAKGTVTFYGDTMIVREVTIPEGESTVNFSYMINPDYYTRIECILYSSMWPWQSEIGNTGPIDISNANMSGLDIVTYKNANKISGTVKLSSGVAPAGGVIVFLNSSIGNFSSHVSIAEGLNSSEFQMYVPKLAQVEIEMTFIMGRGGTVISYNREALVIDMGGVDVTNVIVTVDLNKIPDILKEMSLTADKQSPQQVNTPISWKCQPTDLSGAILYQFSVASNLTWQVMQEYSNNNIFIWTPKSPGNNTIKVEVKHLDVPKANVEIQIGYTITESTPTGGGTPSGGGVPFIPIFPIGGFSGNLNSGNEPDNGVMTIAPICSDTNAKVEITADNYKALLDSAAEENGIKNLIINVNDVSVDEYNAQLPSSALTGATNEANITLNTAVANITLPSNMFSETDVQGAQNIGINVAAVDRSALPESVVQIIGKAPVVDISVTINGNVKPWNNPDAPVTVSIPYTLKGGENPDKITVFYIDGAGNLVNMQGIYDPETKLISFTTTHFSKYLVKENKVTFNDLTGFEGYAGYIESMAAKGIINGIGNNKFAPGKVLTRAEFSKLLVEMLQLDITDRSAIFSDVDTSIWYAPYVNAAYKAGLIKGVGNNRFDPDNTITTQDAALILVRALKYKGITITAGSLSGIKDDKNISNYASEAVGFTVSNGIIRLDSEGNFNAGNTVNRASAAEYIYKIFNFKIV